MDIHIGVNTVPAFQAQAARDTLVENGMLVIWNFAPIHLRVPRGVLVQNEHMAAQLALLSRHPADKLGGYDIPKDKVGEEL